MIKKLISQKDKLILSRAKNLISEEFPIEKLILFGSRAKGVANKFSDYDILVITKNHLNWEQKRRISDLTLDIDLEFDVITDIKIYSKNDIEKSILGQTPFMQNALNEGFLYE
ncbi:MAG TPA: nucleotidyltransferase domain-containing protein [bacterium]